VNPDFLQTILETSHAMKDLAKDKRRSAEVRIQAADTVANLLHVLSDMQHGVNERIMADSMGEEHDHGSESWKR
jgi:hypothetical protein